MTKYLLISFQTCPWVQRAAIVLREKKLDFEFRHIEPNNKPDWFVAISPHKEVPVLRVDDEFSLFESNAIAEWLDETIAPHLSPRDPIRRANNRAWTDYVPTFAKEVNSAAYADDELSYTNAIGRIPSAFDKLEKALEANQTGGPFFNGADYSLVDAAYAPFLQRYFFIDRIGRLGCLQKFPKVEAWAITLMARPSTHSFPAIEFEELYWQNTKRRNKWLFKNHGGSTSTAR